MARVLEEYHLSLFATNASDQYRGGVRLFLPTSMKILIVGGKSVIRGNTYVDAVPSTPCDVSKIDIVETGDGKNYSSVTPAAQTSLGWFGAWRTGNVANGNYTLTAEAFLATGRELLSPPLHVAVQKQ
jgi:hypothetical protein